MCNYYLKLKPLMMSLLAMAMPLLASAYLPEMGSSGQLANPENDFKVNLLLQEKQISGTITEDENGEPLPGVNVVEKGTSNGTVTDLNGKYNLTVPANATIVFSSVGFTTEEVMIGNRSVIDVSMVADIQQLQELVVVGYGTQKKENLTGSVSSISGTEVAKQPIMQTSQALAGTAPGVTVIQNSSQPGSDAATIRIRGTGTLGNSDPLVLIDGVPGNMNGVDPKDIEEISVLKDAASAAIYGSRAANGVVLITTKRGTNQGFRLNYSGYAGFQQPTDMPQYLGGLQYMELHNLARQNLGQDPIYSDQFLNDYENGYQSNPDLYPNTDWLDQIFTENGFQQHHHVSMRGGNEMIKALASISFMDQGGNIVNYNYKRYNARLNTDLKISEKFNFNFDLNYRRSLRKQPARGLEDVVRQGYRIPPIYAAQYSDGSWGPGWNGKNPVAIANVGGIDDDQWNYFRGILKANYRPVEGLELSVMYSPEYDDSWSHDFNRQYNVFNFQTKDLEYTWPERNSLTQSNNRSFTNNLNGIASYEKNFGSHYFKGLAGYELITFRNDWFNAFRDNFPLQDYDQLNAGAQDNMQNNGSASEWSLQSYFARINYDFAGRYLLEANIRRDGSSRFAQGNKYGVFPSFSAGWRISEEPFFDGVNLIDELKLRASWGQLGNQNIGTYPFASTISLGVDYLFGGSPASGAAQTDLANKDISWETTETSNFALDLVMLESRLNFSFEYFIRNTYDILLRLPIPTTIGLNAPFQNAGEVQNRGWDLAFGWQDELGDFNYGINFNISDVKNEVTDLAGAGPFIGGSSIIREGDPMNALYGYQTIGFFNDQAEVDAAPVQFGALAPGDIKYANIPSVDTNNDGVPDQVDDIVNAEDRVVIGDPFPRMTFGGNLTAGYKGFDVSVFLQGVGNRDVYLQGDVARAFDNAGKIQEWHLDYWSEDNLDASYPRLVSTTNHNNYAVSDFWVWSASYLRLRNLTFGYTFPDVMMENIFVNNLRLYFSGQNLFTIDNLPEGWDPEIPNGTAGAIYPITSIYTLGVDVTF